MFTHICFDSEALRSEGWPKNPSAELQALVRLTSDLGITLVVCEPVLSELEKFWVEQAQNTYRSCVSAIDKLRRNAENPEILDRVVVPTESMLLSTFRSAAQNFIQQSKVVRLGVTTRSIKEFFQKANAKQAPFRDEGKGFKDAVIFYSYLDGLLDLGRAQDVCGSAVITRDSDFAGSLEADAQACGLKIKLFRTVADLRATLQKELEESKRRAWEQDQERAKDAILRDMNRIAPFIEGNLEIPESELPWGLMTNVTLKGLMLVSVDSVATAFPDRERNPSAVPITAHFTITISVTVDRFASSGEQSVRVGDTFGFMGRAFDPPRRELVTEELQKKIVLEAVGQTKDGDYVSIEPVRVYLMQSKFLGV